MTGPLSVLVGVSGFLGLVSVIVYFFTRVRTRRAHSSARSIVEGEGLFNSEQVVRVLGQFHDDTSRLEALRALTHVDLRKAQQVLSKVKANVDLGTLGAQTRGAELRLLLTSAVFFIAIALLGFTYSVLSSAPEIGRSLDTSTDGTPPTPPSSPTSEKPIASPPSSPTSEKRIAFSIRAKLDSRQKSKSLEVFIDGRSAGRLAITKERQVASLRVEVTSKGRHGFKISGTADFEGDGQRTLKGSGFIDLDNGSVFDVTVVQDLTNFIWLPESLEVSLIRNAAQSPEVQKRIVFSITDKLGSSQKSESLEIFIDDRRAGVLEVTEGRRSATLEVYVPNEGPHLYRLSGTIRRPPLANSNSLIILGPGQPEPRRDVDWSQEARGYGMIIVENGSAFEVDMDPRTEVCCGTARLSLRPVR